MRLWIGYLLDRLAALDYSDNSICTSHRWEIFLLQFVPRGSYRINVVPTSCIYQASPLRVALAGISNRPHGILFSILKVHDVKPTELWMA